MADSRTNVALAADTKNWTNSHAAHLAKTLDRKTVTAMRSWAEDCTWVDGDLLGEYTDAEIINGVQRHYFGGVAQFLRDDQ